MTDAIKAGTVLIKEGTLMPKPLLLKSEPYSGGWTFVANFDKSELAKEIDKAGWTFFFMAGEIKATAFGFNRQRTIRAAMKRVLVDVQLQKCNCVEVTQVKRSSFLKVPYVTVSVHSRHIQESRSFSSQ